MENQPAPMTENDRKATLGSVFLMGFEGTAVTQHIRTLIEDYRLGAVLLNATNFVSAEQATQLIRELQSVAHAASHEHPLLIAVDQENGIVRSLVDSRWITQLPSSLGVASTRSATNAYEVALATGRELACVGVNWVLGPAIDVILDRAAPGLGSRAFGDDASEVAKLGGAYIRGLRDAGVASTAKHFPLGGTLRFDESSTTVPVVFNSLDQLRQKVIMPFQEAIREDVDAIMAAGVAISSIGPKLMHACFSKKVVTDLLRKQLGYDGVTVSECLEMESISDHIGVGQAAVMGIHAGCDILTICQSLPPQLEALSALSLALDNGALSWGLVQKSAERVQRLRARHTVWQHALNPPGLAQLAVLRPSHRTLAARVYEESITLVRDNDHCIPLSNVLTEHSTILVLSPILHHRIPAADKYHMTSGNVMDDITVAGSGPSTSDNGNGGGGRNNSASYTSGSTSNSNSYTNPPPRRRKTQPAPHGQGLFYGEDYFQEFGRQLASYNFGDIVHTSYTSHGVRTEHEKLIERADAIIIMVADANRNQYQLGFAKHVAALSSLQRHLRVAAGRKPPVVILVSLSSAYDVPSTPDSPFPTHICTYDSSTVALHCLARVLGGDITPNRRIPGIQPPDADDDDAGRPHGHDHTIHQQAWLVERFDLIRDREPFQEFIRGLLETDDALLFRRLEEDTCENDDDDDEEAPRVGNAYADAVMTAGRLAPSYALPASHRSSGRGTAQHFVIRNTSTGAIYGFASALAFPSLERGCISALLVDPEKRELAMGRDLHRSVVRHLSQMAYGITTVQLGAPLTAMFPGVPLDNDNSFPDNVEFFKKMGWNLESSQAQRLYSLLYKQPSPNTADLAQWQADAAAKGLVLEVHSNKTRSRTSHNTSPWSAILEFVNTAQKLPKVAAEQPFAQLIYREAIRAALAMPIDGGDCSSAGSSGGSSGGSDSSDSHGIPPIVVLAVREQFSGAIVGSVLLIRHGSPPNDFAAFNFPHPCRLPPSTSTAVLMCPIVVPQQNETVDSHKTVVHGLAAKAILTARRSGTPSILAHAIPKTMLNALEETGFRVDQVFVMAERPIGDIR
ncbi:hypothetical protein Sste5346_003185 [Sporothrix stenoceras]|uniref:Glycoside hydrolase family 3 N-terminal domain-containing protein n=1 Tax=Sporothrix stenoceras TaxID=5173 RepID=A0ABR3ZDS3_9PEZI